MRENGEGRAERGHGSEFTLTRVVRATRETVWRLLTHPAELSRWLHPGGMTTPAERAHP